MHKLAFSVGLILLITFSIFSPLQILKIESVNAQVTVPKNYIQTVNDPGINSTYAWENFTTGLDPDSYSKIIPGNPNYYDFRIENIGTSYNSLFPGQDTSWTMANHSPNEDSVVVCLEGGTGVTCQIYPDVPMFQPLTSNVTICTNTFTATYWNLTTSKYTWIINLANGLRSMGYNHVYYLGLSSGAWGGGSWMVHIDPGSIFDGVILASAFLNSTYWECQDDVKLLANYAGNVKTKICIMEGVNDVSVDFGNGTQQAEQFYSGITYPQKEFHYFNDGHYLLDKTEVGTGKSFWQVVEEFIYSPDNAQDGVFSAYCKRVGANDWGDCIARQGYYPHLNSYCLDWNNKIIKPMLHYPYIPANIGNDQIILQATGKHSPPIWHGNLADPFKSPQGPTIGATIMLYFNVFVHDNENGGDKWLFNFHEPSPWAGPNMFVLEIFLTRWVVSWPVVNYFESAPPGCGWFEGFAARTTHDNDLHMMTLPFEMPENNQWYYFLYDLETKIHESATAIERWSIGRDQTPVYTVLGFQLMTIAMGVETIGGSWTFQFGDVSLTDMRWGTGQPYTNTMMAEIKTRADGNQYIPKLSGHLGYPNPLRPFMTYTNVTLESDIKEDGKIDVQDLARVSAKFGSTEAVPYTYPYWDYTCDIIKNRVCDISDLAKVASDYGKIATTGNYSTGLGSIKVWMQEFDISGGLGLYWPDPPPGYVGPPWNVMRTIPYTCNLYLEMWDVIDWPFHVGRTISFNPCQNYMDRMVFYNGTTLNQTGICLYAYAYPLHD